MVQLFIVWRLHPRRDFSSVGLLLTHEQVVDGTLDKASVFFPVLVSGVFRVAPQPVFLDLIGILLCLILILAILRELQVL